VRMTGGTTSNWLRNHGPDVLLVVCLRASRGRKVYLDSLGIELQSLLLVCEEFLDILALISLELDHLSHLSIDDNGAIASCNTVNIVC